MRNLHKKLSALILLFLPAAAFSLPATEDWLPDTSGEYVYYSDKSFKDKSIIGFLYYNDETYAARYYSPATLSKQEKDITVYLTVQKDTFPLKFTGERISGMTETGDSDIVNYIHDLFYEFSARRHATSLKKGFVLKTDENFAQFGGSVKIEYSPLVPVFNILSISANDGTPILTVQTTGILASSEDKSFTEFKGIEGLPRDKTRNFKKTKAEPQKASFKSQSVKLDGMWKQSMQNMWLLDDFAIITFSTIKPPSKTEFSGDFMAFMIRKLSQGTNGSYSIWKQHKISAEKKDGARIMNVFYQPLSSNVTRDFKTITPLEDGNLAYFSLTIFDDTYQKNRAYFDRILKSYEP